MASVLALLVLLASATAALAGTDEAPPVTAEQTTTTPSDPTTAPGELNIQWVDPLTMVGSGAAGGEDDARRADVRRQDQDSGSEHRRK